MKSVKRALSTGLQVSALSFWLSLVSPGLVAHVPRSEN